MEISFRYLSTPCRRYEAYFFRLLVFRLCYCVPLKAAVGGRINGKRGGGEGLGFAPSSSDILALLKTAFLNGR